MNQVLSQNEVDALLSAVSDNRIEAEDSSGSDAKQGVVHYDLANQDRDRGLILRVDGLFCRFILTRLPQEADP